MSADDLAAALLSTVFDADPLSGSMYGFPGYDERLPDLSADAEEHVAAALESIAQQAEDHEDQGLAETEHQTLDFVRVLSRGMAEAARVPLTEFTICDTFVAPVPGVLTTLPKLPLDTDERRQGYLVRLRDLPALLTAVGERHQSGARAERTPVARLVEAAVAQLDLLMTDPDLGGVGRADAEDDHFRQSVAETIADDVRPALAAYRDMLRTEILPLARDDDHPGICFVPAGESMYRALARLHTSTTYTPDELHAMGREIIGQVRDELVETGSGLWQTSEPAEIFAHLRDDPELRYRNREEMLEHARRVVAAAEEEAPNWFATIPDEPCTVEPVPEAEEAGMAAAYYMPGAIDGSRQGTYYLNTSKPRERHRYTAEDIAFHEAVPGHHFQLTIAKEATDLPLARRVLHDTACAEGWGLYSERLADEMGLYSDDVARMGLFAADSWRASRLVVDTGLHALGWSRQKAVDWLASNTPMPHIEIESEVDRYISYPGQALAYMVGRREIVRLRALATDRLATAFDLKQFHDLMLRVGILPLPALARTVERWIERSTP
jgi:uncharacterized protein (DUF885 family)